MTTPLLPYSSIRRRKKKRAETRVGKVSGKIRLYGAAKTALRNEVYLRDGGRCQICKAWLPKEGSLWVRAHMAHKTSLGAG